MGGLGIGMYKNQLQELAQRSCFNLPSYSCIREGPDHAPRFKATVNFNGETFNSPTFFSTLRQAEHAAAEVALAMLANRGPSRELAARVLDETGVYKNLLQETGHRAGLNLPVYTTMRSGPGHVPMFSCTVELAGMSFTGVLARTKKQAQKNAAMAAWLALKRMSQSSLSSPSSPSSSESRSSEEQEQVVIARLLASLCRSESKQHAQIDCQHGKQRYIPVCRDLDPPTMGSRVIHGQNWPYATLSPEMALYHMWQQEQLLQLQNHLFTLPLPSFPAPSPQILSQSIFHPGHGLSVPDMEQRHMVSGSRLKMPNPGSELCSSDTSVIGLMSGRSSLTIQEIPEEKTEESSKFLPPVVLSTPVPSHPTLEPSGEVSGLDEHRQKIDSKSSVEKAEQENNHCRKSEQACHRRPGAGSRNSLDGRLQNRLSCDPSLSYPRPHYPQTAYSFRNSGLSSTAAAPMTIRTVCPVSAMRHQPQNRPTQGPVPPRMRSGSPSLVRPRYETVNFGVGRPSSMAPAVRIRSVVPVCSAPPPRKVQYVREEGNLPIESKSTVSDAEPKASLEINKLKI